MMLQKAGFKDIEVKEVNSFYSILGLNLARFFYGKLKFITPLINYIFYKLEVRALSRAEQINQKLSNVMTFAVTARKR